MKERKEPSRLLVVDDEVIVHKSVERALRGESYTIDFANAAADALDRLSIERYDLILTDLKMPGMDGLQLLEELARLEVTTPTIMITGFASLSTAFSALRLGAYDYLAKPFTQAEIRGAVARALRRDASAVPGSRPSGFGPRGTTDTPPPAYRLGHESWVRVDSHTSVTIGLDALFLETTGTPVHLELPAIGDSVDQGGAFAQLVADDGQRHTVRSPIQGSVEEINESAIKTPSLLARDPYGKGWLLHLVPTALEENLGQLKPC